MSSLKNQRRLAQTKVHYKFFNLSEKKKSKKRPKGQDKNLNILRTKRAFKVKLKAFFIIFQGLSVSDLTLHL